jgi:glutamate-1-semialdehyde 2,1-aminomutase
VGAPTDLKHALKVDNVTTTTFPDPNSRSAQLFERARQVMPGANTRHMITFAPYIVYADRGEGCRLWDVDGKPYLDWVNNFSSQIHGHGYAPIVEAVQRQLTKLISCILPSESEVELAELLCERMPGVEQVRFNNSGTEAVMVALKGARGLTGRSKIAKAEGGYHGQYDLVEASFLPTPENWGPAELPAAPPFGRGTPQSLLDEAVIFPYNDTASTLRILESHATELAAVIVDPIPARLGFSQGERDYLLALREFCTRHDVVLVFDEVFCNRAGYHGAHGHVGLTPDMTVMGKIIGGGFPIGAVGGTRSAMSVFDNLAGPLKVSHSGTFTANPISMVAGLASMRGLTPEVFDRLALQGERLRAGLTREFRGCGLNMRANGLGSMTSLQFFEAPIRSYREFHIRSGPGYLQRMQSLHRCMLNEGVLIATRGMMIGSTAMTDADIDETIERSGRALRAFAALDAATR